MLSRKREYQYIEAPEAVWDVADSLPEAENSVADMLTRFHGQFADSMKMHASAPTVTEYLDAHQDWFCRCAQPMKVEPIGKSGYALTIGHFGAFGYDVEPKVGLELLRPDQGIYRIKTIAVPDYVAPGYDVDFRAAMQLVEQPAFSSEQFTGETTLIEWYLDLAVYIQFPKFIQRLPKSMVQSTGDRLLNQIVRQVSRRLTYKVQEDFHTSLGLPLPFKSKQGRGTR
jgi:hypothetical protein